MKIDLVHNGLSFKQLYFMDNATMAAKLDFFINRKVDQAAVSVKTSNFLICFCSFELSCPILEKDSFIENMFITYEEQHNKDQIYRTISHVS